MKTKLTIGLFVLSSFLSCVNSETDRGPIFFGSGNTTYVYPLVSSHEECDLFLQDGVNCAQWMEFTTDSKAEVLVSDILNQGFYSITENQVIVTFPMQSDVESPLIFNANSDFSELTRISDNSNTVWKLQVEGVNPWDL